MELVWDNNPLFAKDCFFTQKPISFWFGLKNSAVFLLASTVDLVAGAILALLSVTLLGMVPFLNKKSISHLSSAAKELRVVLGIAFRCLKSIFPSFESKPHEIFSSCSTFFKRKGEHLAKTHNFFYKHVLTRCCYVGATAALLVEKTLSLVAGIIFLAVSVCSLGKQAFLTDLSFDCLSSFCFLFVDLFEYVLLILTNSSF